MPLLNMHDTDMTDLTDDQLKDELYAALLKKKTFRNFFFLLEIPKKVYQNNSTYYIS